MPVPEISVVISTYNRERSLGSTIDSILSQTAAPPYELIIVDNRSTDGTRSLIEGYAASAAQVRYVYEEKQGVSHGRNAGIRAAAAPLIAFTDDDVTVAPDWLAAMARAFSRHPECGCVGGKVLPSWPKQPPSWLTARHWAPLALVDYGAGQLIDARNPRCLITANMGVRREVFDQIGFFRPEFQKTAGSICSNEDRELQARYWHAGGRCWFDPAIVVHAEVQTFRLDKSYHRKWHQSHGALHALLRDPGFEGSGARVFDIPGHVLRRLFTHTLAALGQTLRGKSEPAFAHELEARFFAGFAASRLAQRRTNAASSGSDSTRTARSATEQAQNKANR